MAEVDYFITTNIQTVFRGAQGHPVGNMITHFVPWPMNYSILVLKHQKSIRLSVTMHQTHLKPPPAGRQLDWGGGCSTGTLQFKDKEKRTVASTRECSRHHLLENLV